MRHYSFGTNTLVVTYDEAGKVRWAHYVDPYSLKGRAFGSRLSPEEEMRELIPRLRQMERILAEYQARFGVKSKTSQTEAKPTAKP